MQIVVVGAGVVGEAICKELSEEGHDIVLIEQNEEVMILQDWLEMVLRMKIYWKRIQIMLIFLLQ